MSSFFLDRPVRLVIAIAMMLGGVLAIYHLPVSQYPPIAPPSISISAFYPGASADTVEDSVTQIIEQKMTGLDQMLYMQATSDWLARAAHPDLRAPAPIPTSPGRRCRTSCSSRCRSSPRRCSGRGCG